ncbi:MAG: histidine kinase dimerization/phospho-acceptor domain-containing protein [Geminicoccaceae bacterium]
MSLLINPLEHELGAPTTGELASFLAHDLRTPLNAVRGFAELLLSGSAGPLTGEMIGLLADIGRAGRTLERAVLCAQELGEPCIMAGASTRSSMRSLLVDAGFAARFRDLPDSVEVVGEAAGWQRLLGVCREHLQDEVAGGAVAAEVGAAGWGRLQLVLSADESHAADPASLLAERHMRRLAASQHTVLLSELPHRPVRLIARCDLSGRCEFVPRRDVLWR